MDKMDKMAAHTTNNTATETKPQRIHWLRSLLVTISINGVVPYVLYMLLQRIVPGATALLIAMLPSLAENGWHWLRNRKTDAFGLLMLGTFALGAALTVAGGSEKLLLLRESFVTGAVGIVFLVSPFIFYGFIGAAVACTYVYRRVAMRKLSRLFG